MNKRELVILLSVGLTQLIQAPAQAGIAVCGNERHTFYEIKSTKDAFKPENECPAKSLTMSRETLDQAWRGHLDGNYKWTGLEVEGLYELNVQALLLWDDIVKASDQDPEKARTSYLNKRLPRDLRDRLNVFKQSVVGFFRTTAVANIDADPKPWAEPYHGWAIPMVHPLFGEIMVEHLAQFTLSRWKPNRAFGFIGMAANGKFEFDMNLTHSDDVWRTLLYFKQLSPVSCGQLGLFGRAARTVLYSYDRDALLKQREFDEAYWLPKTMNSSNSHDVKPLVPFSFYYLLSSARYEADAPCGKLMDIDDGYTSDPYANWPEGPRERLKKLF